MHMPAISQDSRFLEITLLKDLFIALDMIANSEVSPALESNTALGIFAHLGDILFDVLKGVHGTWKVLVGSFEA
jgi:hypothetical protein